MTLLAKRGGKIFRVGIFLDFVWLTTRTPGRTCGEPDVIGLTPMGVILNGSGRVPFHEVVHGKERAPPHAHDLVEVVGVLQAKRQVAPHPRRLARRGVVVPCITR